MQTSLDFFITVKQESSSEHLLKVGFILSDFCMHIIHSCLHLGVTENHTSWTLLNRQALFCVMVLHKSLFINVHKGIHPRNHYT